MAARWVPVAAAEAAATAGGGDLVCSPAGLWLALGAVAAGAEHGTAAELRALLGAAGPEAAGLVTAAARALSGTDALAVATGVWSRATLLPAFQGALPDVAFGPLGDQAALDAWVREATGGLIGRLPLTVPATARMVLVNALALKARWDRPFAAEKTRRRAFTDAAGRLHQVPTMHGEVPLDAVWTTPGGATVVELPCAAAPDGSPGARVRFVLGAPGRSAAEVLPEAWAAERESVRAARVTVDLPRLSLRATIEVTPHLAVLGVRTATTRAADFSLLSGEPLKVSQVAQACLLRVAELGVEAAAVTSVVMVRAAVVHAPHPLRIAFDRPFGIVVLPAADPTGASGDVPLLAAWQASAPADPGPPPAEDRAGAPAARPHAGAERPASRGPDADGPRPRTTPPRSGRSEGPDAGASSSYRLDEGEPEEVRRMTFVAFLPDGSCVAVEHPDGSVRLPSGDVRSGEMWLRDAALRIPLESAGFRMQRVRPFGYEEAARHVFVWVDGDRYQGRRPHATVPWRTGAPEVLAPRLTDPRERAAVRDAVRSRRAQSEESYFADSVRQIELSYLREDNPPEMGSGFGAGPEQWRVQRRMVVDGLHRDGTFLDVGCANGLLMESVAGWAAEAGRAVEPYGVDLSPGLAAEARRRLPHWADRIAVGNALDWTPPDGRRFTFVHVLADCVPPARFPDVVRHALGRLVAPGGRLLVSVYQPVGGTAPQAAERLAATGAAVAGHSSGGGAPGTATTAWCDA
ncbi:serpin family protein [Streptomyces sp. NPDC020917]|uniref:serpin family protein n=1 Tax=Streptomyces sp. NPDC020917 TaxID=3365102 RepID=UPI00379B97EF